MVLTQDLTAVKRTKLLSQRKNKKEELISNKPWSNSYRRKYSRQRGCEFESLFCILPDGSLSNLFVTKLIVFMNEKTENKPKEAGDGLILINALKI